MAEWLLMIYSLGVRSRFQVVCGYTDFLAYPAAAAGATASATGWFNTLRQFDVKRFQPSTGGARPKERYSSAPLLNSIFFQELVNAYDANAADRVFTRTDYDRVLRRQQPDAANWPADLSTLHHWATLSKLFESLEGKNVRERLLTVDEAIAAANDIYRSLARRDVQFDPITGPAHLREWVQAIAMLRTFARL
jgi:hypothetical protein